MSELPVIFMCEGCGHNCGKRCDIISEPDWIYKHRNGKCFAKMSPEKLKQVEEEIQNKNKK